MMSGVPLETCLTFNKRWNNKFYYKVAFCWLFLLIHTITHGYINIKKKYIADYPFGFVEETFNFAIQYLRYDCFFVNYF
jgi:hypothetical protein